MKYIKNIAAALMLVLIMPLFAVKADAADSYGFKTGLSKEVVRPGETVEVTVSLTGYTQAAAEAEPVRGLQVELTLADGVEFVSARSAINDATDAVLANKANYSADDNKIIMMYAKYKENANPSELVLAAPCEDIFKAELKVNPDLTDAGSITLPVQVLMVTGTKNQVTQTGTVEIKYARYPADTVAVNETTGTTYSDLNEALTAARANGDTVKLIADVEDLPAGFLNVPYGVTLDLNGRYVTAGTVVSYGSVIDTATTDADGDEYTAGGIIISNDTTKAFTLLQPDNAYEEDAYIPIYDTTHKDGGCYRFYKGYIKHRGLQDNGDRKVIGFTPRFDDNPEAYSVLRDTSNPELKISLNLGWTVNGNAKTFDYTVGDTYLNDWAKLAAGQVEKDGEVKALVTVTVTGHSKVAADGEVTFDSKGIFTSTTRAVVESPVVSYSHNAAE